VKNIFNKDGASIPDLSAIVKFACVVVSATVGAARGQTTKRPSRLNKHGVERVPVWIGDTLWKGGPMPCRALVPSLLPTGQRPRGRRRRHRKSQAGLSKAFGQGRCAPHSLGNKKKPSLVLLAGAQALFRPTVRVDLVFLAPVVHPTGLRGSMTGVSIICSSARSLLAVRRAHRAPTDRARRSIQALAALRRLFLPRLSTRA